MRTEMEAERKIAVPNDVLETTLKFIAVAAMTPNRVIGLHNEIPWHLPEDLKFFKKTTSGHPILMGRKTWESLGRPLPNRRNLVLSRTLDNAPGAEILRHPDEISKLGLKGTVYVIGGAEIYHLLMPRTSEILLTMVEFAAEGDTLFPPFEEEFELAEVLDRMPGVAEWRRYVRRGV
ncbi:MAG: dihydrofolate reductase region [Verrucomicrobiales bacterium]|nr:dihydrofolate reductase region [Verrucomicrobiales bacterium]